jgi:hypothetical protein
LGEEVNCYVQILTAEGQLFSIKENINVPILLIKKEPGITASLVFLKVQNMSRENDLSVIFYDQFIARIR